jgi:predicted phage tail protein
MTTAVFHGSLAKRYGRTHSFDGATPFLLMQGLILQLGEQFKQHFQERKWCVTLGKPDKTKSNAMCEEQAHQKLEGIDEVHFFPALKGRSGAVRTVIGIVLVVVGVYFGYTPLVQLGGALILGGVAEMLAKKPGIPNQADSSSNPNYFFGGGTNTTTQGGPVPLVYGRVRRAGSVVISQGITVGQQTA